MKNIIKKLKEFYYLKKPMAQRIYNSNRKKINIGTLIFGLWAILSILGVFTPTSTPKNSLEGFYEALQKSNWKEVYSLLSSQTQESFEKTMKKSLDYIISSSASKIEEDLKLKPEDIYLKEALEKINQLKTLNTLKGKEYFVYFMMFFPDNKKAMMQNIAFYEIINEEIKGNRAILTLQNPIQKGNTINFIKEENTWKIIIPFTL